ncbi:hypothetical protein DYBT9623_00304 [Dyadobacter sp. CECT 9623]|uniref:FecR protein domain-containing protein n=1 Tax=Dyadobacter linearis TaxID=2823330 RepID=A0ABM8UJL3_9BACT|nr:FecR domain-containing protein [Dyadobacter sp. CECT 9623]CAG5067583.1 hypothetical protein DYBT9623_00304 [Dyadobacter sp. CECT 9623]
MEDFCQITIEELVLNDKFRELVLCPTPAQELEFNTWIKQHPVEGQKLLVAADMIRSVRIENTPLSALDQAEAVQQIFDFTSRKKQTHRLRPLHYWALGAAAALAVIIGFYILPTRISDSSTSQSEFNDGQGWKWNKSGRTRLIQLADGSSIFLKTGSAIRYPDQFAADQRKVELQGEAFFEVAPDKSRPFYVYSNETVTKVLGTSFSVRAFGEEDQTVVGVRSGSVNVSRLDAGKPVEMVQVAPGQQVTVSKKAGSISKAVLASDDEISAFLRAAANGKNIEVVHYLNTASKAFGVAISFDPKKLKAHKIRANFEEMHLMEQIDAMCKAINASYSVKNGGIVIKSS